MTQKLKQKLYAPIFELGLASQAVPMGRTVKVPVNTLATEKGAGKNQYAMSMGTGWSIQASTSHMLSSSNSIIQYLAE